MSPKVSTSQGKLHHLTGDRKPQFQSIGNQHSGDGNRRLFLYNVNYAPTGSDTFKRNHLGHCDDHWKDDYWGQVPMTAIYWYNAQ